MHQVIPFVTKNDPLKPDFKQECVDDRLIRKECMKGAGSERMTEEETEAIFTKQERYY